MIAVGVLLADQLVKQWVVTNLPLGEPQAVLGETLQWLYVKNPGAAFSFGTGHTWIFTVFSSVIAVFVLLQVPRLRSRPWAVFFGMLLGGTLGNLGDRFFREPGFPSGHVIDFIYTPWMMSAIYNIADIAIVAGMGLFILLTLFGVRLDGLPRRTDDSDLEARAHT